MSQSSCGSVVPKSLGLIINDPLGLPKVYCGLECVTARPREGLNNISEGVYRIFEVALQSVLTTCPYLVPHEYLLRGLR